MSIKLCPYNLNESSYLFALIITISRSQLVSFATNKEKLIVDLFCNNAKLVQYAQEKYIEQTSVNFPIWPLLSF
jgi:hypothetical protein